MAVAERAVKAGQVARAREKPARATVELFAVSAGAVNATAAHLVWPIVSLGLLLRWFHFLCGPAIWHDEAALILNAIGKDFASLLGPLLYSEAAPPLFLWIERAAYLLMGDGKFALRLFPLLASCGALVLFVPLVRRALPPAAAPGALLLLACSDRLLWHACEAKPYSSDALAAVLVAALFCGLRAWQFEARCVVFAALAPALTFLAYPTCFLYGGVLAALGLELGRNRRPRCFAAYVLLLATVVAAFLLMFCGPVRAQRCAPMDQCWQEAFPPWEQPWLVPAWTLRSVVGVFDYCGRPEGGLLIILAVVGAVSMWRRGQRDLVVLLVTPPALALLASCGRAYPFTGARILTYAAPAVFLLVGEGIVVAAHWLRARMRRQATGRPLCRLTFCTDRLAFFVLGVQLVLPLGWSLYRTVVPWHRADFESALNLIHAQRQPGDRIASNSWEGDYYFRNWGTSTNPPERCWLVVAGKLSADERLALAQDCAPYDWPAVSRHEFQGITVLLLQRSGADDG